MIDGDGMIKIFLFLIGFGTRSFIFPCNDTGLVTLYIKEDQDEPLLRLVLLFRLQRGLKSVSSYPEIMTAASMRHLTSICTSTKTCTYILNSHLYNP